MLALFRYIDDPDMIRSLASSPLRWFTRLFADYVQADLIDLITQLFCPCFMLTAGPPSSFKPTSWLLGGSPVRACNLTSFSPCPTGPVDYPLASCHDGPGVLM
jgi:hypothetical protein